MPSVAHSGEAKSSSGGAKAGEGAIGEGAAGAMSEQSSAQLLALDSHAIKTLA